MNRDEVKKELKDILQEFSSNQDIELTVGEILKITDSMTHVWFTRKDLLSALKEKGLSSSWSYIDTYWKYGFLPPFKNILKFHRKDSPIKFSRVITDEGLVTKPSTRAGSIVSRKDMPIFTREEINDLVEKIARLSEQEKSKGLVGQI